MRQEPCCVGAVKKGRWYCRCVHQEYSKVGAVDVQKIVDYGGGAGWGNYYMPDERMLPEDDKHTWQEYTTAS